MSLQLPLGNVNVILQESQLTACGGFGWAKGNMAAARQEKGRSTERIQGGDSPVSDPRETAGSVKRNCVTFPNCNRRFEMAKVEEGIE